MMRSSITSGVLLLAVFSETACLSLAADETAIPKVKLLEVRKIWDRAPHNAFTDLVHWQGRFYCAFREGQGHAGDRGNLRIIVSSDGGEWESAGLLSMDTHDLRDAALSVTPDGRLMVLGGAQHFQDGNHHTGTFVSFSTDGRKFTPPQLVIPVGRWLWRVTWHGDTAFGVSYGTPDDKEQSILHQTKDGLHYEQVLRKLFADGERPTEARLRFAADGTCYCLHRRDGSTKNTAVLGSAKPPYTEWAWNDLGRSMGGPNFLQTPGGAWLAAGRLYDGRPYTALVHLDVDAGTWAPLVRLPSGGDTSYPGMLWHEDLLWISYYSSHEGRTSIYLAKVRVAGNGK